MDKKRAQIIITGVLIIIFIFVLINSISKIKKPLSAKPVAASKELSVVTVAADSQAQPVQVKEEDANTEWVRCPFGGKIYTDKETGVDLKLTGILWDKDNPQALINSQVVKVGDTIEGYRIMDIVKEKVKLSNGVKEILLQLQ